VSGTFSVTTRAQAADLSITKTSTPATPILGQPLTYTLTVINSGPDEAPNVSVSDVLPQSLTYQSASSGCQEDSGTVTCNLGSIANGAQQSVEIIVIPTAAGLVSNSSQVSTTVSDPNSSNNTSLPDQTTVYTHLYLPLILRN
jgi:uncharacterized repeat protein (TIGR01451 family)